MSDPYQTTLGFNDHQVDELAKRAITPAQAVAAGVRPVLTDADRVDGMDSWWSEQAGVLPGMLYPMVSLTPGTPVQYQLKPDTPWVDKDGGTHKYLFATGFQPVLHVARAVPGAMRALLVEGTHQVIAAALYAPENCSVYGISGCWSWKSSLGVTRDLIEITGTDVVVMLDADSSTNPQVYAAGTALKADLRGAGATGVKFAQIGVFASGDKAGLDDVLAMRDASTRTNIIQLLIDDAIEKPAPKAPDAKRIEAARRREERAAEPGGAFFDPMSGGLLVKTLSEFIRESYPAALTAEHKVAMYDGGVYGIDGLSFLSAITQLLGERFVSSHHTNAEKFTTGELANEGRFLPDRTTAPLLNVRNGMLDLVTGELLPHSPDYFSTAQFDVDWDPAARAPVYEQWLIDSIGERQAADLEEATSAMLDPSTTPTKALFLFGPSRSGKSTFLRLLMAVAGARNTSGVTLHQLVENRFMAANVYGKLLNVAADLSANHVEDLSIFKLMTGEDLIMADRKYGGQFSFTNRALFAFSANELPTVGEGSRAYSERIKPFHFSRSFAGAEDPSIELAMLEELPGILARWVAAWQARRARGVALATDPEVRERFEIASDKVRQFASSRLVVGKGFMTTSEVHQAFREWAADEGKMTLGRTKMAARLATIPGLERCQNASKVKGWRVSKRAPGQIDDLGGSTTLLPEAELKPNTAPKDKTDTPQVTPVKTDKTPLAGAEYAELNLPSPVARKHVPIPVQGVGTINTGTGQGGLNSAYIAPPDWASRHALPFTSQCSLGHDEALVDGLWYACPTCHPATVRPLPEGDSL